MIISLFPVLLHEFDIPDFKLWQLFVLDPSGVIIELNYDVTKEPRGSKGPTKRNLFDAGRPFQ